MVGKIVMVALVGIHIAAVVVMEGAHTVGVYVQ